MRFEKGLPLLVSAFAVHLGAQAWTGPYNFFPPLNPPGKEVEHAALNGKPGPHRGKVLLVRDHVNSGLWFWDPAAPTGVSDASDGQELNNFACGGTAFDRDGIS